MSDFDLFDLSRDYEKKMSNLEPMKRKKLALDAEMIKKQNEFDIWKNATQEQINKLIESVKALEEEIEAMKEQYPYLDDLHNELQQLFSKYKKPENEPDISAILPASSQPKEVKEMKEEKPKTTKPKQKFDPKESKNAIVIDEQFTEQQQSQSDPNKRITRLATGSLPQQKKKKALDTDGEESLFLSRAD